MEQEQFKKEILPLRRSLMAYALRLLENKQDAEDIIQEVFLKLWYMCNELEQYDSVFALSVTMTKHLCLNFLKSNRRAFDELYEVLLQDTHPSPDAQLEQQDQLKQVMKIITQLPDLQQTILRMKHIDGFEVEEIAGLIGSTPKAIRMNLSRARRKVKELFLKTEVV